MPMPRLVMCSGLEFRFSEYLSIMITLAFENGSIVGVSGIWDGRCEGFSGWQGSWWGHSEGFLQVFQESVRNGWWFHVDRVLDLRCAVPRTFLSYQGQLADGQLEDPINVWGIANLVIHDGSTPDTTPNSTLSTDVEII